jgi:hypothetical protein
MIADTVIGQVRQGWPRVKLPVQDRQDPGFVGMEDGVPAGSPRGPPWYPDGNVFPGQSIRRFMLD